MSRKTPIRTLPVSVEAHESVKTAAALLGETQKEFTERAVFERIRKNRKRLEAASKAVETDRAEVIRRVEEFFGGR